MKIKLLRKVFSGNTYQIFLSFLLIFTLSAGMLAGLPHAAYAATADHGAAKKSIYVALGDSVPAGYGLNDAKSCYVNQFSDAMAQEGYSNTMYNYAKSGDTTQDLLAKLKNMESENPDALKKIKSAAMITINIGGNNVLGPLVKAVNDQLQQQIKDLGITSIAKADSAQLYTIGFSLYTLSLNEEQLSEIKQGAQSFADDFPKIIEWVKTNAPGANIIVSTIYNPIPSQLSFYATSETLLKEMNAVITDGSKQGGYAAADVYSAFIKEQAKGTQILNLNIGQYKTPISIDIHPNPAGHKLIAKIHQDIFKKFPCIIKTDPKAPVTAFLPLSGDIDEDGTLKTDITQKSLSSLITRAQTEARRSGREKDGISIILSNTDTDLSNINLTFETAAINMLKSKGVKNITVNTNILKFSFDKEAIKNIWKKTKGKVTWKAVPATGLSKEAKKLIGSRPAFRITMKDSKGNKITDLGKGKIALSIRYPKANDKKSSLHGALVNSKGQAKILSGSGYADGWINLSSNSFGTFGVGCY